MHPSPVCLLLCCRLSRAARSNPSKNAKISSSRPDHNDAGQHCFSALEVGLVGLETGEWETSGCNKTLELRCQPIQWYNAIYFHLQNTRINLSEDVNAEQLTSLRFNKADKYKEKIKISNVFVIWYKSNKPITIAKINSRNLIWPS